MHEPDIDRDAKDEKEMDCPVDAEGEPLDGQNGNKDHVGVEKGAKKADAGKQYVCPLPSALQERDQGEAEQDNKSQKRRDDISPGCVQTVRNHLSLSESDGFLYLTSSPLSRFRERAI